MHFRLAGVFKLAIDVSVSLDWLFGDLRTLTFTR